MKSFLLLLLISNIAFCQGGFELSKGKVIHKYTGDALAEVFVGYPGSGYGTITNIDGNFILKFPILSKDSTLLISKIGFKPIYAHYSDLKSFIFLEPESETRSIYTVKDPRFFIKNVIDSIENNYSNALYYQQGFYVEKVSIPSIGTVRLTEGQLRIERDPKNKTQKIKLLSGRNFETKNNKNINQKWGFNNGTQLNCRSLEIELPDFLQKDVSPKYNFSLDSSVVSLDGNVLIIFNFSPLNKSQKGGKIGKLFIDPETMAIVRIEYHITENSLQDLIDENIKDENIKGQSAKIVFQYRKMQNRWYLSYSKANFEVDFTNKGNYALKSNLEMMYMGAETQQMNAFTIENSEILQSKLEFNAKNTSYNFWRNSSHMIPSIETQKFLKSQ